MATCFFPGDVQPSRVELDTLAGSNIPLYRFRSKTPAPTDPDARAATHAAFGFRWFLPEILKHRTLWRDVLIASLVIQLLALGLPLMTQVIIDKVIVHRTESTLIAIAVAMALFITFSAGLTWSRQYLISHTGTRIDAVLGASVFRHLTELPARYFQTRPTGVIAARLHGIEQIREFMCSAAVSLILDIPFLSICLALMFWYSVTLTCVVLGILTLIVVASVIVTPMFQSRLNHEFLLGARNQAFVTEYVAGMETVKSLQMEPVLQRRFGDYLASHLNAGFKTRLVANSYNVVTSTLEQSMTVCILMLGAWIVMKPTPETVGFTIGMLVAFQMFASKLSQPIMRIVGLWQQFQQARLAVQRLGDLMNVPPEPYSLVPARAQQASGGPVISIRDLHFQYDEKRPPLFEGFSLDIQPGECVALMGPSGCGKSTLAKLLQGFYQPTRGQILVAGVNAQHLAANELRSAMGVVPQETILFSGTVLENLLLANPQAAFEEVVNACRMAEIHEVIEALPKGYQEELGERGSGLSGGQRQRIAIARALLKRPRLLIFDEATSNLDQHTAESFAKTVDTLRGKVAILFITHSRMLGLRFDRVITMQPGRNAGEAMGLHLAASDGKERG